MKKNFEKHILQAEVRALTRERRLEGYAALFGVEAQIGNRFIEKIANGAFTKSLSRNQDILALVDHDPSRVLARTRSGTLQLSEDSRGLAFDISVPDTQTGHDILELARRGDLGGMSFGFNPVDENINGNIRELREIELVEISVVLAFPAYQGTTVNARSGYAHGQTLDMIHRQRSLRIEELNQ